jgi:hypothetical protein
MAAKHAEQIDAVTNIATEALPSSWIPVEKKLSSNPITKETIATIKMTGTTSKKGPKYLTAFSHRSQISVTRREASLTCVLGSAVT